MKILVTGGAGLIGVPLRHALRARGDQVTAIDVTDFGRGDTGLTMMSINDAAALRGLFASQRFDAVVHCGALSGPMMARDEPLKMVEVNIDGTAQLLEQARLFNISRFVFCSSISVYGDAGEATITEATPLRPSSVYGASKVAGEQLLRGYTAQFGVRGVSLRLARIYGQYRRANCHVASLIGDAARGEVTEIPCDPEFRYHYIYVDDVVTAMLAVLDAPSLLHLEYNIGSQEVTTMPELAEIARSVVPGVDVRLVSGADDVPDVQAAFDITRAIADLGWRPRFKMADGIAAQLRAPSLHAAPS